MIIAFNDDATVSVWPDLAAVQREYEGVDVEDGAYQFYSDDGIWLEPVFVEPNQHGRHFGIAWVSSGMFRLEPRPDQNDRQLWRALQEHPHPGELGAFQSVAELRNYLAARGVQVDSPVTLGRVRDEHVSPDGTLRLVLTRDEQGEITLGFAGFSWHTHGDTLAATYPTEDVSGASPESASTRFVQDVIGNRIVIAVQRFGGEIRDVWVTDNPSNDLRYKEPGESLEFRRWDGTEVTPPIQTLPADLARRSLSQREIVLSEDDAMLALDYWEQSGIALLGWEAWMKYKDGSVGHPPLVLGSAELDTDLPSIDFFRATIREEASRWRDSGDPEGREIYFCITLASVQ